MDVATRPTVSELQGDNDYTPIAQKYWLGKEKPPTRAQQNVLQDLSSKLRKEAFALRPLLLLENLQLLELYLWPTFTEDATNDHVLLLALLINTKKREGLPTWNLFNDNPTNFPIFFRRLLFLLIDINTAPEVRTPLLVTIIGAFQSLDNGLVRTEIAPLVSIGIWHNLQSEEVRIRLLEDQPQSKKAWRAAAKRFDGADKETQGRITFARAWLYTLLLDFLDLLYNSERQTTAYTAYCERFLEFLIDLESQFPTRRYVNTLLKDVNILVALQESPLLRSNALLQDLARLLEHFIDFPFDDHTGQELTDVEVAQRHNGNLARLQRTALKKNKEKLSLLTLASYNSLDQTKELYGYLDVLSDEELATFAQDLGFRTTYPHTVALQGRRSLTMTILLSAYTRRTTFRNEVRKAATLPTEQIVYEEKYTMNEYYDGTRPVALPKLNLQYLTTHDFLWRSFELLRRDAFFQVRSDMEDTVKRLKPRRDQMGKVRFDGASRLALPVRELAMLGATVPKVGQDIPSDVRAEIILDVGRLTPQVRQEWESVRNGDVVYLLAVLPEEKMKRLQAGDDQKAQKPFTYLRAAEVKQVMDDKGKAMRGGREDTNGHTPRGRTLRYLLKLDAIAYQSDLQSKASPNVYESINVIVRRRGRENNFKAILDSIRDLVLSNVPMPTWLQDVFLGLGDPAGATYKNLPSALNTVDFRDTFLNFKHLKEALPDKDIVTDPRGSEVGPPYMIEFLKDVADVEQGNAKRRKQDSGQAAKNEAKKGGTETKGTRSTRASKKRRLEEVEEAQNTPVESVKVSTYKTPNPGPYPVDEPKVNAVRFTPAQIEAITSGTQPGLTIMLGPPGTGKTDVATQIINNIYHNFPTERTLLIAHSNQALNQLFQKIIALDIDERHLLRLGHGEGDLIVQNDSSFSKHGRVESLMERGSLLLREVSRLAASISAPGAHGNTCETAEYFFTVWVQPLWEKYWDVASAPESVTEQISEAFPFHYFFSNAPAPVFPDGIEKEAALDAARGCYRHIEKIFSELSEIRPFEVLRNNRDKSNYLLVQEARIIAMTSTHAAMRRDEIVNLGFAYDNVVMEEAAQITEVEAFIPLALQKPTNDALPLKRVIMCGDHLQNSPVVQNHALRQYCNLEQSMFQRLVRLGVPQILLDKQGRARSSIADLYRWRYPGLGDLPIVQESPEFQISNAGLRHDYQFINVPDYKGRGETEPSAHFIQNLGEAEYIVAMYMYMRLLGYPAHRISILTTYAGQRALIRDVLGHRCARNKLFGLPRIVTTVDKYQGEQNDYVLLSLVRTKHVGYLRDIRRLTVALSRARLGLYIFGRREVFESVPELAPAFAYLFRRADKLELVTGEMYPALRGINEETEAVATMEGVEHLGQYVFEMTQAKVKNLREGTEVLPAAAAAAETVSSTADLEDAEEDEGDEDEEVYAVQDDDGDGDGDDGEE